MGDSIDTFLAEHLNVWWLRPENALWDAVASYEIRQLDFKELDIDLGSGNGIYSFITAGGRFSPKFDWFIQTDISRPEKNVFDYFNPSKFKQDFILKMPDIPCKVAFDKKKVMLEQAKVLHWYKTYVEADISEPYPFENGSVSTIFSNIIYWISDPRPAMKEINRISKTGSKVILCLPDKKFIDFCPTYKAHQEEFKWLYPLNRRRAEYLKKCFSFSDIRELAHSYNFKIVYHKKYLSREFLLFWDIGLRPLIRPLLKMVSFLSKRERLEVKNDWVKQLKEDLAPVAEREIKAGSPKGFHLCVFEKVRNN